MSASRKYVDRDIPYLWGGKTLRGMDCSALVWFILRDAGLDVGYRYSGALKEWATPISRSQARPGDLVFWPGHVGVFIGDGKVIDHGGPGLGANIRTIWGSPTYGRVPT